MVGPDLSSVGARLQPEFVYQMVRDPRRVMPETVMPKVDMPAATLELIVDWTRAYERNEDLGGVCVRQIAEYLHP